ncbi:hypothetical protein [Ruicaihuangia caeni]|uniref:Uncharacterized protein n=1 Tax=Ruicaihuangia caeni TaxID=3042517 RepID=A0AAW6T5G5_9MICO|nr:hypothetical protein [Klugiella sp. YN-L-19]MDI2098484.1 hypothetical protein [Klugiella sp. YN-L-19]
MLIALLALVAGAALALLLDSGAAQAADDTGDGAGLGRLSAESSTAPGETPVPVASAAEQLGAVAASIGNSVVSRADAASADDVAARIAVIAEPAVESVVEAATPVVDSVADVRGSDGAERIESPVSDVQQSSETTSAELPALAPVDDLTGISVGPALSSVDGALVALHELTQAVVATGVEVLDAAGGYMSEGLQGFADCVVSPVFEWVPAAAGEASVDAAAPALDVATAPTAPESAAPRAATVGALEPGADDAHSAAPAVAGSSTPAQLDFNTVSTAGAATGSGGGSSTSAAEADSATTARVDAGRASLPLSTIVPASPTYGFDSTPD